MMIELPVGDEHGFTDNVLLDVPLHPGGLAVPLMPLGVLGQSIWNMSARQSD